MFSEDFINHNADRTAEMVSQCLFFYAFRTSGVVQVHQSGESADAAPRL